MRSESAVLERRGLGILILGTVGLSLIPVMAQIVMRIVPPHHFPGLWMLCATVWATLFMLRQGAHASLERIRVLRWPLVVIGIFATGWVYFYFYGVSRLDAAVATFLINSRIVWGAIFGVFLFGERIGTAQAIGTATAIVGVTLVLSGDFRGGEPLAMISVLIAAIFYVLMAATVKRHVPRDDVPLALLARFVGPTVLLTVVSFSLDPDVSFLSGRAALMLAVGALIGPFLSFLFVFTAMPLVRLGVQVLFQSLPIVFTSVFSFLVFGTIPTMLQCMGGALILVSVFVVGMNGSRDAAGVPPLFLRDQRKEHR